MIIWSNKGSYILLWSVVCVCVCVCVCVSVACCLFVFVFNSKAPPSCSCNHVHLKNKKKRGRPRSIVVDHGRPWSTMVDHGLPWSTMVFSVSPTAVRTRCSHRTDQRGPPLPPQLTECAATAPLSKPVQRTEARVSRTLPQERPPR